MLQSQSADFLASIERARQSRNAALTLARTPIDFQDCAASPLAISAAQRLAALANQSTLRDWLPGAVASAAEPEGALALTITSEVEITGNSHLFVFGLYLFNVHVVRRGGDM